MSGRSNPPTVSSCPIIRRSLALAPGTRLGAYEITAQIGAGGMGEVYRARDMKLNREVAIKVLPDSFASDADRLARFTREAQTLASLNHPNIAQIYGLEESNGVRALVMELVEGEDVSQRIARGPIAIDDALPIAKQIADALEAAHEQGIVHRDLKPANIKVRPDGAVKVLDFGLAKLAHVGATAGPSDVTASPTITSPAMMTGVGVLLGTAAYMSPEQAKGREADKRSDIWGFGCVLYEMLTGRRAFDGEDMTEVLGAVVRLEPNWEALSSDVPQPIRTLLQRCLVKDRRKRTADIAAALFVLDHQAGIAAPGTASAAPLRRRPLWRRAAPIAAAAAIGALLAGAAISFLTQPVSPSVVRTTIPTSGSSALSLQGTDRDVAITPDGSRVVYRGNNKLLVRTLNQLEPTALGGLAAPRDVFTSPDGVWIGFFDGNILKKVAIAGGSPISVCTVQGAPRGATWGPDGTIIFATNTPSIGLQSVFADAGAEPTVLTKSDRERGDDRWPEFLPGGEAVLFTIIPATGGSENAQIAVLDLRTRTSKVLIRGGSHAHYVPTGHLVYGAMGTLRAVAFDLERLAVVGASVEVVEGVVTTPQGAANFGVASNGSLVYISGARTSGTGTVFSVDRQGNSSPLQGLTLNSYRDVQVSPDGKRLALATSTDVWSYDLERATPSLVTTGPAEGRSPLWSPNGQRILYTSRRAGYPELFWRPADGTGVDQGLFARAKDLIDLVATGWSSDGSQFLFTEVAASGQSAIGQMAIKGAPDPTMLLTGGFNAFAAVSPNGGWIAYTSDRTGQFEIYVERYPQLGQQQKISTGGGMRPLWSRDGQELFFSNYKRQMLVVPVQLGTTLVFGRQQELFEFAMVALPGSRPYDIAPDGRRFMIIGSGEGDVSGGEATQQIVFVQNWFEELKSKVPTK